MSPNRLSGDEENHIRSIVEAVCQTQEIGPEAVDKLCSHAEADEEEQQVHMYQISNVLVVYSSMTSFFDRSCWHLSITWTNREKAMSVLMSL